MNFFFYIEHEKTLMEIKKIFIKKPVHQTYSLHKHSVHVLIMFH